MKKTLFFCILTAVTAAVFANPMYTLIGESTEDNISEVLGSIYGGTFTGTGYYGSGQYTQSYKQFSNGTGYVATRVVDWAGPLSLNIGTSSPNPFGMIPDFFTDQNWADGIAGLELEAKIAGNTNSLLLNGTQILGNTPGDNAQIVLPHAFTWDLRTIGSGADIIWNSTNVANELDHMITFEIINTVNPINKTWLICWEDLPECTSDFDYNDYVVELRVMDNPPGVVPAPGAILLASMGCGLVGYIRKRRAL